MAKLLEITGKAISGEWGQDDDTGTGIPVLRTTNFTNEGFVNYKNVVTRSISKKNIAEKYLRHGDVIIEKSGGSDKQPVGRVIFFEGEENKYLFNNFTGLLRVQNPEEWLPKYVFYALYAYYRNGGTRAFENRTTGLHNLQVDNYVKSVDIPKLSYRKQQHICETLDHVRDVVAYREQQLTKLDKLIKARFVEMFGDFEFNPKKFPIYLLCNLCDVGSSKRIYQEEQSTSGIPFLKISDLVDLIDAGTFSASTFILSDRYERLCSQGLTPKTNDVLITSRGTLGKCYIVKKSDEFYFQDGMISWLSNISEKVSSTYISYLFMQPYIQKQILALQAGSTVAYLSISMLKRLNIILPPLSLQNQFSDFVAEVDKSKVEVQKALDQTQLLFDSLMQQYFG